MRAYQYLTALAMVCLLAACGSAPPQETPRQGLLPSSYPGYHPYWMNTAWQAELFEAVQSKVHLPADTAASATSEIYGTVKFVYDNGTIKDPVIIKSTGNPDLDKLLMQQVVTAKVPKPFGLQTDRPHAFQLPLQMFTIYKSFQYSIYAAIDSKKEYGREAILRGDTGTTTVAFDYRDGKADNIKVGKSSEHEDMDQTSIVAVVNAIMPPPPPGYAGKTLHLQAIICYCLNSSKSCPKGNNVIVVEGTRIVRRTVTTTNVMR